MSQVRVHSGKLHWSGEHWVTMLRPESGDKPTAIVSHFSLRFSPAGEGNVAVVRLSDEQSSFCAVCTDSRDAAEFTLAHFFRNRVDYYHDDLPVVDAHFKRHGDTGRESGWRIESNGRCVITRFVAQNPPVIAHGIFRKGYDTFTTLFFTYAAIVELDGKRLPGHPYPRDIWRRSIGGDRSSCVFALGETLVATGGGECL